MHYQFLESDDFSFGLTGGFRNYGYHYVDEPGKDTANMQRWKIAPDWDVKLTDDLRFNGWLSMYKFANDLNTTGYADTRVETGNRSAIYLQRNSCFASELLSRARLQYGRQPQ